jgi:hypothetical protein
MAQRFGAAEQRLRTLNQRIGAAIRRVNAMIRRAGWTRESNASNSLILRTNWLPWRHAVIANRRVGSTNQHGD